jgi:hypothetical protein
VRLFLPVIETTTRSQIGSSKCNRPVQLLCQVKTSCTWLVQESAPAFLLWQHNPKTHRHGSNRAHAKPSFLTSFIQSWALARGVPRRTGGLNVLQTLRLLPGSNMQRTYIGESCSSSAPFVKHKSWVELPLGGGGVVLAPRTTALHRLFLPEMTRASKFCRSCPIYQGAWLLPNLLKRLTEASTQSNQSNQYGLRGEILGARTGGAWRDKKWERCCNGVETAETSSEN